MRAAIGCAVLIAVSLCASGCSECSMLDPTSCDPGLVCEAVQGHSNATCVPPLEVVGHVTDASSGKGIGQAVVWATTVIGTPVTQVTFSGDDGTFTLRIPVVRQDAQGTPATGHFVLQAGAREHLPYPSGLQESLPIDLTQAHQTGKDLPWVLQTDQTELRLRSVPASRANTPAIAGTVGLAQGQVGAVVVAEADGQPAAWSYVDALGQFILFNVPPGSYALDVFSRGVIYAPVGVSVSAGSDVAGVGIPVVSTGGASVPGKVELPPSSAGTSVALAVASTWNPTLRRGALVPGVRVPDPGKAPNVTSTFSLPGVADGSYVVAAGLESDGLSMPPGQPPAKVTVSNGTPSASPTLTLIPAVDLVSPGKGLGVASVSAPPTLVWKAYTGAAAYHLEVVDSDGNAVVDHPSLDASTTQLVYDGPALTPGALYQWRITALDGEGTPLATSEDHEGVFRVK